MSSMVWRFRVRLGLALMQLGADVCGLKYFSHRMNDRTVTVAYANAPFAGMTVAIAPPECASALHGHSACEGRKET